MPSIMTGVDKMHREHKVLARGLCILLDFMGKKNIGCIIHEACHNFNLILNLRLTVFHIASSQYLLKPSSRWLLFPGGLSLLPLIALGCISARDQISWRHDLFQLFNLREWTPAHAKSSFSHEMRHFHMLNHLSDFSNIPLKAEE